MQAGFKPVFVDANLNDLAFDYDQLAAKITPQTRAIFLVHILGFPADVARIKQIIGDRDIILLEDTCETQGRNNQWREGQQFRSRQQFQLLLGSTI